MSITRETRRESYEAIKPTTAVRRQIILDILGNRAMTAMETTRELFIRGHTPI